MGTIRFSPEFKESVVKKLLSRGNQNIADFCQANNLALSSVTKWQRLCATGSLVKNKKSNSKHTAEEILKIIVETYPLDEENLGLYLRKNGLFLNQITEWRASILISMDQPKMKLNKKDERDAKINILEKDLKRKNAALAEASALLILQKKVQEIWPMTDADEDR